MAFDWEDVLGAEGGDMQDAYDAELERTDRIEHGGWGPSSDLTVIDRLPGDGWPYPEDYMDYRDDLPECDGNYPFCQGDCSECGYCRCCDCNYEQCNGNCEECTYDRGVGRETQASPGDPPPANGSADSGCGCCLDEDDEFAC
jgi:hypothetical protein